MFKKGEIVNMQKCIDRINELEGTINRNFIRKRDIVECEICGCLVERKEKNIGLGEIRQRDIANYYFQSKPKLEDYIYYPYYCKIHMPKEK